MEKTREITSDDNLREFEEQTREDTSEVSTGNDGFVDLGTIGLRRSPRLRELGQTKKSSSKSDLYKVTKAIGLFAMQVSEKYQTSVDTI